MQSLQQRDRAGLPGGVSETFQKQSTVNQIKSTLAIFFGTGIGLGIAGFAVVGGAAKVFNGLGGIISLVVSVIALALIGPILGVVTGIRISSALSDEPAVQRYATAGVSTAAGHILFFIVGYILTSAGLSTLGESGLASQIPGVSRFLVPVVIGAIGTAIAGIIAVYAAQSMSDNH
jgi:hypothetical protein